ncbi:conserved protein of unknown function [Tepidanaerobacter acetatoxydans Re1]|uniref:SbsA Ig-like domain-containing protein n=1 Tax=Tepidanaerobacter acetatoxydans (strain DSM 21804 / JCM 16047 / Re1) TaxID=1209989 RepID=F4LTA1_TEPAE|nr:Ig-like domain-containing protein [Tepidanaerobacter acetatoxydans]AEE92501.1 hypothetical protein TepRe1_2399 [Tepidanaerobacter acetatoxydans Re1]CCP27449.1 conserved protein of unknown function [Tepidanaerobacter acetatoxydans Re1]
MKKDTVITPGTPDTLKNITFTNIGSAPAVTSTSAEAKLSEDGKTLTIIASGTDYFDGQYAVLVPVAVTDTEGNPIEAYSAVVTLKDTVRPTISGPTYPDNNTVKFEFSEPMNLANAAALEGISTLKDKNGATVSITGLITLAADKKSFTLNMTGLTVGEEYKLTIVGAKDFASNLISPNPVTVSFKKQVVDNVNPEVVSVKAVYNSKLIVTFSEPIKTTGTIFKLDIGSTGSLVAVTTTNASVSDDKTVVTVDLTTAGFTSLSGLKRVDITEFQDLSGNPAIIAESAYNTLINFVADTEAPKVKAVTVETISGTRYIVVEFDEDVTVTAAALTPVTYVVDGVQKTLTSGIVAAAVTSHDKDGDGNDESVKINTENYDGSNSVMPNGKYTITLPANLVADAAGNTNALTTINVTIGDIADTTKPTVMSAVYSDNDTFIVLFSEEVTNATALNTANYTVEGEKVFVSAIFDGDKTKVKLTLRDGAIDVNGERSLEIKNIADKAGNVMDSVTLSVNFIENVKPQMLSAKIVDVDKVLVTFSEGIKATSAVPANFTVKVNGVPDPVTSVTKEDGTSVAVGDTKVLLTLTTGIANISDVVTVEIADGVIEDMNGNLNKGAKTVTATR